MTAKLWLQQSPYDQPDSYFRLLDIQKKDPERAKALQKWERDARIEIQYDSERDLTCLLIDDKISRRQRARIILNSDELDELRMLLSTHILQAENPIEAYVKGRAFRSLIAKHRTKKQQEKGEAAKKAAGIVIKNK